MSGKTVLLIGGFLVLLFFNFILFPIAPHWMHAEIHSGAILDVYYGFTRRDVMQAWNTLSNQDLMAIHYLTMIVDNIYLLFYGLYFYFVLKTILPHKLKKLALVSFIVSFSDFMENLGIIMLSCRFPDINDGLVGFTSFFNKLKWTLIWVVLLLGLYSAGYYLFHRLFSNGSKKILH